MKKLKTNFPINYAKLHAITTGESHAVCPPPLDNSELFNWIGISIDMTNLHIEQNINTKREGILCTLNVNM
jgi:hypothetical protein